MVGNVQSMHENMLRTYKSPYYIIFGGALIETEMQLE